MFSFPDQTFHLVQFLPIRQFLQLTLNIIFHHLDHCRLALSRMVIFIKFSRIAIGEVLHNIAHSFRRRGFINHHPTTIIHPSTKPTLMRSPSLCILVLLMIVIKLHGVGSWFPLVMHISIKK